MHINLIHPMVVADCFKNSIQIAKTFVYTGTDDVFSSVTPYMPNYIYQPTSSVRPKRIRANSVLGQKMNLP